MNPNKAINWRHSLRKLAITLGEMFYGATVYEMVRDIHKERAALERLFIMVVFGDLLGVPILPQIGRASCRERV